MAIPTLAEGPPPLTVEAADAALDEIDFIAAAVRGADTIMSVILQNHATRMTALTLGQMSAINRR
jgi:hypothetical protein